MPQLDVTEYSNLAADNLGRVIMAGQEPPMAAQPLAVGATSQQSAAFGDKTRFVRLHSDVPCRVSLGGNPTATPSSMRLGAGATEYLGVSPGMRIAVIQTT